MTAHMFKGFGDDSNHSVGVVLSKVSYWVGITCKSSEGESHGTQIIMDNGQVISVGVSPIDVTEAMEGSLNHG